MKFSIILADPPWKYSFERSVANGGATYPKMEFDELAELPVHQVADRNCALFLWTTGPKLDLAAPLMRAWGFRYCTIAFTWVKVNPNHPDPLLISTNDLYSGTGHYTKGNVELCLLGARGSIPVVSKKVRQVVVTPRGSHSAKPEEVRGRIMELLGDGPSLELFARSPRSGWTTLGNELDGKHIKGSLEELAGTFPCDNRMTIKTA
jgi:N6-adenosine-specific RNA methylase IME4